MLPPNMIGLAEEQIHELKLKDVFEEICVPSGDFIASADPIGRRNGQGTKLGDTKGQNQNLERGGDSYFRAQ